MAVQRGELGQRALAGRPVDLGPAGRLRRERGQNRVLKRGGVLARPDGLAPARDAVELEASNVARIVRLTSSEDGGHVTVIVGPPDSRDDGGGFRPTALMERVWRAVDDRPGLTTNGIRDAVRGNHQAREKALGVLIAEGFLERRQDGQASQHYVVRPYRAGDEE